MNGCASPQYAFARYGRFWAVYDPAGSLVCVTVYKKGAAEVIRRLSPLDQSLEDQAPPALPTQPADVTPAPGAVRTRASRRYDLSQ